MTRMLLTILFMIIAVARASADDGQGCPVGEQGAVGAFTADSCASDRNADSFNPYKFTASKLIAPGAMLAAGVTGIYAFKGFKRSVQADLASRHTSPADDYIQFVSTAGYLTLGFIPGVGGKSGFGDRLLAGATAYIILSAVTEGLKVTFRELRPDNPWERNSFPSGHTARAFAGAELMRIEYGNLIATAGYATAIATGLLRVVNNRHWVNDVLGGAAIGILSARIAYWLLPWERRLFGLDRKKGRAQSALVVPMAGTVNGLSLTVTF